MTKMFKTFFIGNILTKISENHNKIAKILPIIIF